LHEEQATESAMSMGEAHAGCRPREMLLDEANGVVSVEMNAIEGRDGTMQGNCKMGG
jgi:hypothetical protein